MGSREHRRRSIVKKLKLDLSNHQKSTVENHEFPLKHNGFPPPVAGIGLAF